MGSVLDTTVFIALERALVARPAVDARAQVAERLRAVLGPAEEVAMASITASELLHGVHRAGPAQVARREAFVEALLTMFPPLPFDLAAARAHSRIWAQLAASGVDVGAHDRIVAATAIAAGWRVATANVREFERIAGLEVVPLTFD